MNEVMVVPYVCDACDEDREGARVVFSTEATDDRGVEVVVTKRWTVCPPCAEDVFTRIGEPSPWSDEDFKTVVQPGEDLTSAQQGGFASHVPPGEAPASR